MLLNHQDLVGLKGRIAIDFETKGTDPYHDPAIGLGVWCEDAGVIGYLPISSQLDLHKLRQSIETWEDGAWVMAHNLKFELHYLQLEQQTLDRFKWFDTMVAEHLLNEERALDLGSTETRRLKSRTKKGYLEQSKEHGGIKHIADWPLELAAEYCTNDCRITYEIAREQIPRLKREQLIKLFRTQMEYELNLYHIERRGIAIDIEAFEAMQQQVDHLVASGDDKLAGMLEQIGLEMINYNSSKQLSELLYQNLAMPWPEMPPELAGSPKAAKYNGTRTAADFLAEMKHPIPELILQLKKVRKIGSYLKKYKELALREGDSLVIHPTFNITGTVTGRLSSSSPNMQQVSDKDVGTKLTEDGQGLKLRTIFTARPGHKVVSIDYKQMEVVAFAIFSKEPTMISLVETGGDMHSQVAELVLGKYDKTKRKVVKTLNFGLLYGLGMAGMAEQMGVSQEEASRYMNMYMSKFSRVRPWMVEIERQLDRQGYVRYWSGRKRRIPDRRYHYRGVNAVVQGGCADILAVATNRVADYLRQSGEGNIVALIHDEMLMEIKEGSLEQTIAKVRELMSVPDLLGVAFNTDVEYGTHWGAPEVTE